MSARSEKARMREALEITESNLSSLIAAKYSNYRMMQGWRDMCRRALGVLPYEVVPDPSPELLLAREILAPEILADITHLRTAGEGAGS